MKYLALDMGDRWTGVAISDALGMLARPYTTVETRRIASFLQETIDQELITEIIIGYPKTLRDTESEQTKKIQTERKQLESHFPNTPFKFWDERLTSKQAARIKPSKNKEDKLASHAIAAALILQSYLERLAYQKSINEK